MRIAPLVVSAVIAALQDQDVPRRAEADDDEPESSWRVLLWTVPAETRMNREELLEALGREKSWLYAKTSEKCPRDDRIPCRRDGGSKDLIFLAGEIREWLREREEIVHPGSMAREDLYRQDPNLKNGR